ncbi:MAG: nuclear transport factor 2 family protein [Anaeromyxobacter sp.]|nr:nuclear transport factor 2 family protein [Anaeromyxobacter sp.]MBL0275566.1 nuclear transport factor 2 family protein [Anaeromyxobacter sp.]
MNTLTRLTLALAVSLSLASAGFAEDQPAAAADPMAGWAPPVLKQEKKDRKEIEALLKKMETCSTKGALDDAAALIDFPVLMVTDDAKGEGTGEPWSREQWVQMMKPFYEKPMPPGSMVPGKRTIVLLTDSLALVGAGWTMAAGPKKVSGTSGMVLLRKGGEWRVKAMVEGGWGGTPMPGEPATAPAK